MAQKKKWQRPKLIVIARGSSEEAVLAGCKTGAGQTAGAVEVQNNWNCVWNVPSNCTACSAVEAS